MKRFRNEGILNKDFNERIPEHFSQQMQEIFNKMTVEGKYKIIGSGAIQGIVYGADVDLAGDIREEKDDSVTREKILKLFQELFKKELKERNIYITDLKCGINKEGNALRWNKDTIKKGFQVSSDGEVYKFVDHIMDIAIFKLDFVAFINGLFIEFSENYYLTLGGKHNFDPNKATPQAISDNLMKEARELYKEGKYLKSIKRLFASLRQLNKDNEMQERILRVITSQVGLMNKCKADLETIAIMLTQKFKKVPINTIRIALQNIKQNFMTIGEIDFRGESSAKEIDLLSAKGVTQEHMYDGVVMLSEYFGEVLNDAVKTGFIDKHKDIKKLISQGKEKKEKK